MNNKHAYSVGDIVKLKSGGPDMTVKECVSNLGSGLLYRCQWFAGKKLDVGVFPENSLLEATDE